MSTHLPSGCKLDGNILVTKSFADRQFCKVRGIMRAVTRPVSLSQLASKFKFDEGTIR